MNYRNKINLLSKVFDYCFILVASLSDVSFFYQRVTKIVSA